MQPSDLLSDVKKNLIIDFSDDDDFITGLIASAMSYAEGFQNQANGYYAENTMTDATKRGVIMLASNMYESRDGSTGGFFGDNVQAAGQIMTTVNNLLRLERDWQV